MQIADRQIYWQMLCIMSLIETLFDGFVWRSYHDSFHVLYLFYFSARYCGNDNNGSKTERAKNHSIDQSAIYARVH